MNIPTDLRYTKNDEWVRVEGKLGTVGITDYAQDQLSDIVFAEVILNVGAPANKGAVLGTVESVKAASDVYLPVSGTVTAVNDLLSETPEAINTDPYGQAWLLVLELSNPAELDGLMDAAAYSTYLASREH